MINVHGFGSAGATPIHKSSEVRGFVGGSGCCLNPRVKPEPEPATFRGFVDGFGCHFLSWVWVWFFPNPPEPGPLPFQWCQYGPARPTCAVPNEPIYENGLGLARHRNWPCRAGPARFHEQ
jgi:hypothetical protein